MSILNAITQWAVNLSDWESDAVRRLLTKNKLTDEDELELLNMLKNNCGLLTNEAVKMPVSLKKGDIQNVDYKALKLTLKAVNGLKNVNAIKDGSELLFGHRGLNVLYGENGTGKSGYARVLKRACKARDTKERILPNAFKDKTSERAEATFKISINEEKDKEIIWRDEEPFESLLSNISVFDSKSAMVIVDENNEVTYLPYGAFVFEELVALFKKIKKKLEDEKPIINVLDFKEINEHTVAYQFISNISHSTNELELHELTKWSDIDEGELKRLKLEVADAEINDPLKVAQKIRRTKSRLSKLKKEVETVNDNLSKKKVIHFENTVKNYIEAKKACDMVSQQSLSTEPLKGAGETAWQILYKAAKEYSTKEAYPKSDFPELGNESVCVLCMQPLSEETKIRFRRFQTYMENDTNKNLERANSELVNETTNIKNISVPTLDAYSDLLEDIKEKDKELAIILEDWLKGVKKRLEEVRLMLSNKTFTDISISDNNPTDKLDKLISQLELEATVKESSADKEYLKGVKKQLSELEARKAVVNRKESIIKYISDLKLEYKYKICINKINITAITRKGREIISNALTPRLMDELEKELKVLGVGHIQLILKATGKDGETRHRLVLNQSQTTGNVKLSEILSEGEHRVVALAGYLAELKLGEHQCPIVLDDPVSSLDHRYREKIAERLVKESKNRQVLIFTHDIAFLKSLEIYLREEQDVYFHIQTIKRISGVAGQLTKGRPWHAMTNTERIGYLKNELNGFKSQYDKNIETYNDKAAQLFGLLRETWESFIEEVLFNGVIQRHSEAIQTQRLKAVEITNKDYQTLELAMSKCSKWMIGHDKSNALDINRPSPDEIEEELKNIEKISKEIRNRYKTIQKGREELLSPNVPEIG